MFNTFKLKNNYDKKIFQPDNGLLTVAYGTYGKATKRNRQGGEERNR